MRSGCSICGWVRDILEAHPELTSKEQTSLANPIACEDVLGACLGPAADSRKGMFICLQPNGQLTLVTGMMTNVPLVNLL